MKGRFFMDYELMMNSNIKIGQKAPDFTAVTTYGNRSLKDYKGKWLVFFSHPRRFHTSVYNRDDSIFKSIFLFPKYEYRVIRAKHR